MLVLNVFLSPISMAFAVIIIGYSLGRLKIFKVSLDLSGVLVVAVLAGWLLEAVKPQCISDISELSESLKPFSTIGTALFVSSIGLATGGILDYQKSKDLKAIITGSVMSVSAFAVMRLISFFDGRISASKLLGAMCGALTSTPGLSAVCELKDVIAEEAVLGYGSTYLFGVTATVLFVQVQNRQAQETCQSEQQIETTTQSKAALSGLIQIGIVVILGRLVGNIEICGFSLGASGGMLCAGIIMGLVVRRYFSIKLLSSKGLAPFRNFGLVMFFVGNGIPAGIKLCNGFDIDVVLYGMLMTITPLLLGSVFSRLIFRHESVSETVAGGMTSTPAIGILIEKFKNICLSRYALAYFGALITTVVLVRIS